MSQNKKDGKKNEKKNIADFTINPEELKTFPQYNKLLINVSTNDPELTPVVNDYLATLKLDSPILHLHRAELVQTARERKEYEGEDGDLRSVPPHVLANIIKNKLLEKDYELMKDKREKVKALEDKPEHAEDLKALLYGIDCVHLLQDFPYSISELEELEKVGYRHSLAISIINSKGLRDEDEEEEEAEEEADETHEEAENPETVKKERVWLEKETETASILKDSLRKKNYTSYTLHTFVLDAEKDENGELQYEKELLAEKMSEILANVQSKYRELNYYNGSVGSGLTPNSIHLKEVEADQAPSIYSYNKYIDDLGLKNDSIKITHLLDAMLHFVDHSTEVEPVKHEDDEGLEEHEEYDPSKETAEVIGLDIFKILSADNSTKAEVSTQAETSVSTNPLQKFCHMSGQRENQVFLDYNKIAYGFYENDGSYKSVQVHNGDQEGPMWVGGREKKIQELLKVLKVPGVMRHKMPIIPKVKEEQRIIRKAEILPYLDTMSYEQFECFDHFAQYEELIKEKYPDHVTMLKDKIFKEEVSIEVFVYRYLTHILKGAECKYVYNEHDDSLQVWMGYNGSSQLYTKNFFTKVSGQLTFLDYLLLAQEVLSQRQNEAYTDYNLPNTLQPLSQNNQDMFADDLWLLRTLEVGAGIHKQTMNLCISNETLIVNTGASKLNLRFFETDYQVIISFEDTFTSKVEQKEREVEDLDKAKDKKADPKKADPKAQQKGAKKDEVEKKKEIYYETSLVRAGESAVTTVSKGQHKIKLWANGDIQVINNKIDGYRVYRPDNAIVKLQGDVRTTFTSTGEYQVYKNFSTESVSVDGKRVVRNVMTPNEPHENGVYAISEEEDADTGAKCITRQDNTLFVKYYAQDEEEIKLYEEYISYFDDTINKYDYNFQILEQKHKDYLKLREYQKGCQICQNCLENNPNAEDPSCEQCENDPLIKILLTLVDPDVNGIKKVGKLHIDLYDKAYKLYDSVYRILKRKSVEGSEDTYFYLLSIQGNYSLVCPDGNLHQLSRNVVEEMGRESIKNFMEAVLAYEELSAEHYGVLYAKLKENQFLIYDKNGNKLQKDKSTSKIEYAQPKDREWVANGEEPAYVTEDVDLPEEFAYVKNGSMNYREVGQEENKEKPAKVNYQQYLFVVYPNENQAREYLDQNQINNFINSSSNEPLKYMVGSLGRKDIVKYTFLNNYVTANLLEEEIRQEFQELPITGRHMIFKTRLYYQTKEWLKPTEPIKFYSIRNIYQIRGYDETNREFYYEVINAYSQKKILDDENFRRLDTHYLGRLQVMDFRKLLSKVSRKEDLIDQDRIDLFEDMGEERLREERRPFELAKQEKDAKDQSRDNYFGSKRTFGFYTTRQVQHLGKIIARKGPKRKTFYKNQVDTNKTHTKFWNADEGIGWIQINETQNDTYRNERDPMRLTKLERRREEMRSTSAVAENTIELPAEDRVEIVPERQYEEEEQQQQQFQETKSERNERLRMDTQNRYLQHKKNVFAERDAILNEQSKKDKFANEMYVIKKSKEFNNYGTLRTKDEFKDTKILVKSNPPQELNRENLLKEVFAERRVRNAGAFGLHANLNSLQSNLEFRKMGTHQLQSLTPFKNEENLKDSVRNMLGDYENTKPAISVYPDTLNFGILARGYLYAFTFEIVNEEYMPQRFHLKLRSIPTQGSDEMKDDKRFTLNYQPGPLATGMKKMVDLLYTADELTMDDFAAELQIFTKKNIFKIQVKGSVIKDEDWIRQNDFSMEKYGTSITNKRVKILQKLDN